MLLAFEGLILHRFIWTQRPTLVPNVHKVYETASQVFEFPCQ